MSTEEAGDDRADAEELLSDEAEAALLERLTEAIGPITDSVAERARTQWPDPERRVP